GEAGHSRAARLELRARARQRVLRQSRQGDETRAHPVERAEDPARRRQRERGDGPERERRPRADPPARGGVPATLAEPRQGAAGAGGKRGGGTRPPDVTDGEEEAKARRAKVAPRSGGLAPQGHHGHLAAMIRKLKSGGFRLYSRKKDPRTGKRKNLGTFKSLAAAKPHDRAVQFFKRH